MGVFVNPLTGEVEAECDCDENAAGTPGPQGPPGQDGAQGEQGDQGFPGAQGEPGAKGDKGDTGATGATGAAGPPGADGEPGEDGQPGATGATGATGIAGSTGPQGSMGFPGDDGVDGEPGPPGLQGSQGVAGVQGIPGLDGNDGDDGLPLPGAAGAAGPTGITGPQGAVGFAIDGEDGMDSVVPGARGLIGSAGATGAQGAVGFGVDGIDGEDSLIPGPAGSGPQGATGAVGATGNLFLSSFDGDDSVGEPLFAIPSGSVLGLGVPTRIAFWQTPTMLGSDAALNWDNTNKRVGIGTTAPATQLHVVANSSSSITIENFGGIPILALQQNGGTIASPSGTLNNTSLGYIYWAGRDDAGSKGGAGYVEAQATQDWTSTARGTRIVFSNNPDGATFPVEHVRIGSNGNTGIGGTSLTALFNVGASDQFEVNSSGNIIKLNNVTTSFPAANATGVLANNGSGTYSIIANGANGGGLPTGTNTHTLRFDGTNWVDTGVFTNDGTNIQTTGKLTTYNNIATNGLGVPGIFKEVQVGVQSGNQTIASYTPPATAGRYRLSGAITTTSGTNTGTVQFTVDYRDSQGTTHTADIIPILTITAGTTALTLTGTGASKEHKMMTCEITINNAGIAIVVKVVTTGTVNYTAAATIEQLA